MVDDDVTNERWHCRKSCRNATAWDFVWGGLLAAHPNDVDDDEENDDLDTVMPPRRPTTTTTARRQIIIVRLLCFK
jgi:hypothetical protein